MNTIRHKIRRSIVLVLALLLAMAIGGCGLLGGREEMQTTSGSDSSGADSPGEAALGEITDPSEEDDPDGTTPDTTPQNQTRRLRADIQEPLEQGEWRLADDRATAALGRTDLDPEFRLELEAYRDLARAADTGDEAVAADAVDRLQRIEPEFIEDLTVRQVLPEGIRPDIDFDADRVATAAGNSTDASGNGSAGARVIESVRLYERLADAHAQDDATAIARATEALAALDPDLARRLPLGPAAVDADPTVRSGG